jgi:hypothetical protein
MSELPTIHSGGRDSLQAAALRPELSLLLPTTPLLMSDGNLINNHWHRFS